MRSSLSSTHRAAQHRSLPTPRAVIHWAHSTHLAQAAEISTLSRQAGLDEARVWGASSAMNLTPRGLARMLQSVAAIRELNASGGLMPARDLQRLVTRFRELAMNHAEPPKSTGSGGAALGTALFSAALYRNVEPLNLEGAAARDFIANIEGQPTRTDPERWFKFWSEQCTLLGKMPTLGDLQGVIKANLPSFARTYLVSKPPPPIVTRGEPPKSVHDFHVVLFGTRTDSWWGDEGLTLETVGHSGEGSLWARLMRVKPPYVFYTNKESLITAFAAKVHVRDPERTDTRPLVVGRILERGSRLGVIECLSVDFNLGQLTHPGVKALAKHSIDTILSSAPGTTERIAAVKELMAVMKNGPGRATPDAGSLRAVWTEMVLVQVLSVYFEESGLANQYQFGKVDADRVFDIGRAYQIFQEMEKRGTLVSLQDVQAMLSRISGEGRKPSQELR